MSISSFNRRNFIGALGVSGAAAGLIRGASIGSTATPAFTDADIVNFALNLEYLEAEFYTMATRGQTIEELGVNTFGTGATGPTTGGRKVDLSLAPTATSTIALQIAADERAHVQFLRDTLSTMGAVPIAKPAINLDALGVGFNDQAQFLTLARAFEDVGVTAYAGAAPLLQSKDILAAAARIAETESLHSGNIRLQVALQGVPTTALDAVDIIPPPSGDAYFSVDLLGLTQTRTPGQVLWIVYGFQANAIKGGFFPNGVNGTINMSSAAASQPPVLSLP